MPGVDFNVLRTEITMEQVLNQLGFQPTNRSGNQLHGPCPVHGSTSSGSRTFSVNLDSADLCRVLGREVPWIERW